MKRKSIARRVPLIGIDIIETSRKELGKKLGDWDPVKRTIRVRRQQSWVGKNITFLHEAFHCIDDAMLGSKIRKRRVEHNWIENAAMNLLLLLVEAGLWRGITKHEMRAFYIRSKKGLKTQKVKR